MKLVVTFGILAFMMNGCIPIPAVYSSYYMPTYHDAKTRSPGCVGPKTKVFFDMPDNVQVEVRTDNALANTSAQNPIIIHFKIPRGVSFQFVDDTIRVENNSTYSKVAIENRLRVESKHFGAESDMVFDFDKLCPIDSKTIEKNSQQIHASFNYSVKFGEYKNDFPNQLELLFQPITIDKKIVSFNPLFLNSKQINQNRHYYIPAFKKIFEECAIHSEIKECKEYGHSLWLQKGYAVSNDHFNMSGKVRTSEVGSYIYVRNEVNIFSAESFRLPVPVINIIDKTSGKKYYGNPEQKNITFECGSYTVPITTPIQVLSNKAAEYSDVYINGSIENLQSKEIAILLPSIMINGKKFDFKPIKIFLKPFDMEILPFNC
ncbi:MAG: hypothetical protein AB7S65_09335 [Sulfuricurvum sp.]